MPALIADSRAVCSTHAAPAGNAPGQTTLCLFPSRCCIATSCISFDLTGFHSADSLSSVAPSTWIQHPLPQKLDGHIQCPHLAQLVLEALQLMQQLPPTWGDMAAPAQSLSPTRGTPAPTPWHIPAMQAHIPLVSLAGTGWHQA